MNIIFVLIIFTTIVLVHELGHFWAARRAGIKVEEFSIGMGPRLLKFKKGETLYSLKLFPIGGSCRMLGEEYDEEGKEMEQNPRSFNAASRGWRAVVLIGGAALNIAFALIIAVIVALFRFDTDPVVSTIDESSPFYIAGAEVGDRIT
ncbi:MAG: site-2 protease family protein, partial [Defluviitaleaceae bacterium]|nr:site-2 protease family protein [Defluviitaleaceae bacterium]